ncbi:MAG: ribonuclease HII [Firmicutes bacterium]|nr:ribonuclease HII [Bacillota bacterium]
MTKEERLQKLRDRAVELRKFENEYREAGHSIIAGVDEVGRGPLAGPVVTACVVLRDDYEGIGIDDSKKLNEKKREELYSEILDNSVCYGFGLCDNNVIDEVNILEATKLAMKQAVTSAEEMLKKNAGKEKFDVVLVDAVTIPGINNKQISMIKGDANSLSIAAASILAKVKRDRMMREYDDIYPGYDFASNKGYGTAAHYAGIKERGLTPIHRRTFLKNIQDK